MGPIREKQLDPSFVQEIVKRDGSVPLTGDLDLGSNKITGLASAVSSTDAATLQQLEDLAGIVASSNKNMSPTDTSGNFYGSGLAMSATPLEHSYVQVYVNGIKIKIADGDRTAGEAYFSDDSGATAKLIADIASGDMLFWNGIIAGYDLDTSDKVDFDYMV